MAFTIFLPDDFFDAVVEFPAGQHHPAAALQAFHANIGAQAHHAPFIAAARVRLTQPHDIIQVDFLEHLLIIPPVI